TPRSPVLIRKDASPRLSGIVLRCMEKQKDARFQSALELEETVMTDFGERIDTLATKIYPRTSSNRISRIVVEKLADPPAPTPPKKSGTMGFVLAAAALIVVIVCFSIFGGKGDDKETQQSAKSAVVAAPTPVPLTQEQREEAAATERVKAAKEKLAKWVALTQQDGSLVSSGVMLEKINWATNSFQPVTLETTNKNVFPVEVNYYVADAVLNYQGIDLRDSWKPVTGSVNLGGYGFGSAFDSAAILIQPRATDQLSLVPANKFEFPAGLFVRSLKLDGLQFFASTAAETMAEKTKQPDQKAPASLVLPPLPAELTELPKSLSADPLLKKAFEDAFEYKMPDGDESNEKLAFSSRGESAENFLKFLVRAQAASDSGRVLDPSLVQVRELKLDAITGAIDLMLEIDSSGHDVEVCVFIARGDQRLTLMSGQKPQPVRRPLRGILTPSQKFHVTDFRDRKRLPLVDLFRKDADPGALSFQSSDEIRIDRLLVLCAYTREDRPQNSKPQPLGYKVFTGLRATR
ncbi:MAG: hypothetical protein ABI579_07275, partial [Candidatus Sumerlaeota bacterium]